MDCVGTGKDIFIYRESKTDHCRIQDLLEELPYSIQGVQMCIGAHTILHLYT